MQGDTKALEPVVTVACEFFVLIFVVALDCLHCILRKKRQVVS